MKTIQLITKTVANMKEIGIPADMTIGTFKLTSNGSLYKWAGKCGEYRTTVIEFELHFKPSHIQTLKNMGVKILFNTVVMAGLSDQALRFKSGKEAIKQGDYAPYYYMGNPLNKQTAVVENWLNATARCLPQVLAELDKYCRENHMHHVAIHNNTILANAGWKIKTKYPSVVTVESQYKDIKAIRKTAQGKPASVLLPIQKIVLNLK